MAISIEYKGWKFQFDSIPSPKELEDRYLERVAKLKGAGAEILGAEQGVLTGPVPLTPMQKWFFSHDFEAPSHWNHGIRWAPSQRFEPAIWRRAWRSVLEQHDALRLRFERAGDGWTQQYAPMPEHTPFAIVELQPRDDEDLERAISETIRESHAELDIETGSIARMVYIHCGDDRPAQILLVIHHLCIGGFSWTILAGDLQEAAAKIAAGRPIELPRKKTSLRAWASGIEQLSVERDDVEYWLGGEFEEAVALPVDHDVPGGKPTEATTRSVHRKSESDVVARFLGSEADDRIALLAGLAETLWNWRDSDRVAIALEGHAREEKLVPDADVSRTIGWYNTMYPALFTRNTSEDDLYDEIDRQLVDVPERTLLYMTAKYSAGDEPWRERLRAQPEPDLLFNYYGLLTGADAQRAIGDVRSMRGPANRRTHRHEIYVHHDGAQFSCDWTYSNELHDRATIEFLASTFLDSVIRVCRTQLEETL